MQSSQMNSFFISEVLSLINESLQIIILSFKNVTVDTVNAEKKLDISQKKLDIIPKKVGHHPKKSWTLIQKKLDISQKYVRHYLKYVLLFKIIFYNKIEFWILPRRSSIFYRILRGRLPHPHKTRFKSDSEISYLFFDLFFFLKAKPIINRIIRKRNSLFPNQI